MAVSSFTSKFYNRAYNHETSLAIEANALYTASFEDLETVSCFFDFRETKENSLQENWQFVVDFAIVNEPKSATKYIFAADIEPLHNHELLKY